MSVFVISDNDTNTSDPIFGTLNAAKNEVTTLANAELAVASSTYSGPNYLVEIRSTPDQLVTHIVVQQTTVTSDSGINYTNVVEWKHRQWIISERVTQ